jgi:hypothetical protein
MLGLLDQRGVQVKHPGGVKPPRSRPAARALCAAALALLAASSPALAQTSSEKVASAQALFDEGLRLINAGQLAAACPKLAASQKLDPGMGTKFRLADCYEKLGKTASAWALFIDLGDEARAAKRKDREEFARKRAADLAPKLARMTIAVAPESAKLAGLEVRRDGTALDKAVWDVALPVDPGEHFLTVTAPGKKPWESKMVVALPAKTIEITVPALEDKPKEVIAKAPEPAPLVVVKRSVVPAVVLGGVAVVALGVGGALLGVGGGKKGNAITLHDQILGDKHACVTGPAGAGNFDSRCGDLKSQLDSAYMLQNIGGVTMAVGGAAAIAAVTYLLVPPSRNTKESPTLKVVPVAGREQSGFVVSGSF